MIWEFDTPRSRWWSFTRRLDNANHCVEIYHRKADRWVFIIVGVCGAAFLIWLSVKDYL